MSDRPPFIFAAKWKGVLLAGETVEIAVPEQRASWRLVQVVTNLDSDAEVGLSMADYRVIDGRLAVAALERIKFTTILPPRYPIRIEVKAARVVTDIVIAFVCERVQEY